LIDIISFTYSPTMRDLDPDLLRGFVAVAEAGSFTAAAALTHRTQSAVSMQIRRLEDLVGRRLIDREVKPVRPTLDGERLLGHARRLLDLQRAALADFAGIEPAGPVRIGTPDDYALRFLTEALAHFARSHLAVEVSVTCDLSGALVERAAAGEVDLTLAARPAGNRTGDGSMLRVLGRESLVWALPRRVPVPPLAPLPLALMPPGCPFRGIAIEAVATAGRSWRPAFLSNAVTGVAAAVAAGLGVTVLAEDNLTPDLKAAGPAEGLPPLPDIEIVMIGPAPDAGPAAHALAALIVERVTL
jgi:DNA-binding transcriptional LysR family regulator